MKTLLDDSFGPLDTIVQSQIPTALLDNIQVATKQLRQRLSTDHRPWLDLKALLNEYRQQREETLFNLGYENGFTAGCTQMLSRLRPHPPDLDYHRLVEKIRKALVLAQCQSETQITALLETALALTFESRNVGT